MWKTRRLHVLPMVVVFVVLFADEEMCSSPLHFRLVPQYGTKSKCYTVIQHGENDGNTRLLR